MTHAPLVMVPGIGADGAVWGDMPAATVLCSGAATIEAMADDILGRAPPRFALAGHSLGGYVALAMIARAPARVERLALLSTNAAADSPAQRAARAGTIEAAGRDYAGLVEALMPMLLRPAAHRVAPIRETLRDMLLRAGATRFLRQQHAAGARPDARRTLAAIAVPTLVLAGQDDRLVAAGHARDMAEAIPGAELVMIPRCGHVPMHEAPDTTRAAIEAWLAAPAPRRSEVAARGLS